MTVFAALMAGGAAWYVFNEAPVQTRALRAYKAGNYQEALGLFEEWAAQPGVKNVPEKLRVPLAYIMDIKARLNPVNTVIAQPPQATQSAAVKTEPGRPDGQPGSSAADVIAQAQAQAVAEAANAQEITLANRTPHKPVGKDEILITTIKNLGNFPFNPEKDTTVPADVMALDGAKVKINGYMIPLTQAEKITKFALVPSLVGCCFGQPPGVEHIITAYAPTDHPADYTTDEIVVEGRLRVRIDRKEEFTNSIFEMDVTDVRPKE